MQVVGKKKSERLRMHQCKAARWVGDTVASDTYEVQVLPCIILNLRDVFLQQQLVACHGCHAIFICFSLLGMTDKRKSFLSFLLIY